MTTEEYQRLIREAQAEDGARALLRAAGEIARVAGHFDDLSETKIKRIVEDLKRIAELKRPKVVVAPVSIPGDVRDF